MMTYGPYSRLLNSSLTVPPLTSRIWTQDSRSRPYVVPLLTSRLWTQHEDTLKTHVLFMLNRSADTKPMKTNKLNDWYINLHMSSRIQTQDYKEHLCDLHKYNARSFCQHTSNQNDHPKWLKLRLSHMSSRIQTQDYKEHFCDHQKYNAQSCCQHTSNEN